jgi:hypothetical protein
MTVLQPALGCQVRDPDTLQLLDPAGEDVTINGFYLRRLQCGDVIDMSGTLSVGGEVTSPAAHHAPAHRRPHKED